MRSPRRTNPRTGKSSSEDTLDELRLRRVESILTEEIASLIVRGGLKDPRISKLISVSGVSVSKDGAYAKVRVSGFVEDSELASAVAALNHAAGFIQRHVAAHVKSRNTPKLTFLADTSQRDGFDITQKIRDALEE